MPPLSPELDPHFEEAARLNNLDPMLLRALASGESGNDARAVSPKGAGGLMQIMPDTAQRYGIADPYDPVQAIYGGAKILNDNLTKAEAAKAAGANIDPTDEALRSYFAGPGGGNRGPETARYPGYIAQKYLALQGGQGEPSAPASGIDMLAAARGPIPPAGTVATNAKPPSNAPDTFEAAPPGVAALAALSGQGTAPTPQVRLTSASEPGGVETQSAQVAPDPEIMDFLNAARKRLGIQPAGVPQPNVAPSGVSSPGVPPGQEINPQAVAEAIARIDRATVLGMAPNPYDVEVAKRAPGLSGDPAYERAVAAAKEAGTKQQQWNPTTGQWENMPGVTQSAEDLKKAEAVGHTLGTPQTARQGESVGMMTRPGEAPPVSFQEQYQSPRLPEATVSQPPPLGSPPGTPPSAVTMPGGAGAIAQSAIAQEAGKVAANPTLDAEKVASADFGDLRKAYQGNQGSIQNLQNFLQAASIVGTGKGTGLSGEAAAWLKSINVDPQKLSLADPAEVEKMRKASTQAVFGAIKGVSNRPAYQEFQMLDKAMPNPDLQPEANRAIAASLLGRMQWENNMFEAWDKSRRESGSHLAFNLPEWAKANPIMGFQHTAYTGIPEIPNRGIVGNPAAPAFQEGQTARNPRGGPPLVYRGGRWVPQ